MNKDYKCTDLLYISLSFSLSLSLTCSLDLQHVISMMLCAEEPGHEAKEEDRKIGGHLLEATNEE